MDERRLAKINEFRRNEAIYKPKMKDKYKVHFESVKDLQNHYIAKSSSPAEFHKRGKQFKINKTRINKIISTLPTGKIKDNERFKSYEEFSKFKPKLKL